MKTDNKTSLTPSERRTAVWVDNPIADSSEFSRLEHDMRRSQRLRSIGIWTMTLLVFGAIVGGFMVFAHETQTMDEAAPFKAHSVGHVIDGDPAAVPVKTP